jgi:hypothetical protein
MNNELPVSLSPSPWQPPFYSPSLWVQRL